MKKPKREIRFYVDYRKPNAITKKDHYLIPLIKEILAQFEDVKNFTKIKIRQVFYQIRMFEDSEELITFLIRFGAFKYLTMLFSLCNSSVSEQHLINDRLFDFLYGFVKTYLDNIFIYSKTLKKHLHICQVLQYLRETRLQANIDKCEFHV